MLHITNGDEAANRLRRAKLPGEVLPWIDVLHEGPVPPGLEPREFRRLRVRFLTEAGLTRKDYARRRFARRDRGLERAWQHDEVVLWFEADLYDQLQLAQLLHFFAQDRPGRPDLSLVLPERTPDGDSFQAIGHLPAPEVQGLFGGRAMALGDQLELGRTAWEAFTEPDPRALEGLVLTGTPALPMLGEALRRHMEQFPALENGLSRTERQLLGVIADGIFEPRRIFEAQQKLERRPFLGDSVFWLYLERLSAADEPAIARADGEPFCRPEACRSEEAFHEQVLVITIFGDELRGGRADWVERNGIDRWLGGVHLRPGKVWRWDAGSECLVPPA